MYHNVVMGTRPETAVNPVKERLEPPDWIATLLGADSTQLHSDHPGVRIHKSENDPLALVSAVIADADGLSARDFQHCVEQAYLAIHAALRESRHAHPIRFWNFIPRINRPVGEGLDRYMVFNIGRFRAFTRWYGLRNFGSLVATASGVGHRGGDLSIHCLASRAPGAAVENPRQVPAYNYSSHYGPRPPSFARGTICAIHDCDGSGAAPARPMLLVGGTASICGQRSRHQSDVAGQTRETLANLEALVQAARGRVSTAGGGLGAVARSQPFHHFQYLRVYLVRPEHHKIVQSLLAGRFPNATVDWRRADLCRPELLVEIEGVADLSPATALSAGDGSAATNGFAPSAQKSTFLLESAEGKTRCPQTDMTSS